MSPRSKDTAPTISIAITKADGTVASYDGADAAAATALIADSAAGAQAASVAMSATTKTGEGRALSRNVTVTNDGETVVAATLADATAWIAEVDGA
jgi:hypothetical protein